MHDSIQDALDDKRIFNGLTLLREQFQKQFNLPFSTLHSFEIIQLPQVTFNYSPLRGRAVGTHYPSHPYLLQQVQLLPY